MNQNEWNQFTEDFDYVKEFYDVLFPSGKIEIGYWPNAGFMNPCFGKDLKKLSHEDNIKVRISPNKRLFDWDWTGDAPEKKLHGP